MLTHGDLFCANSHFRACVLGQDLSYCFPDYDGGYSGLASTQYIIDKFQSLYAKHRKDEVRVWVWAPFFGG